MRELSFVEKLKFKLNGSVTKRALVIGDADNDGKNELVCANLQGELAIFKGKNPNRFAGASGLGMITACAIGDVMNINRNLVVAINMEGWLFTFNVTPTELKSTNSTPFESICSQARAPGELSNRCSTATCRYHKSLVVFYEQRMPANCKELLLADLDGDGQNELIIGLTDRVLRTYKWINIDDNRGKFVGIYKWEFADQIGSVSLNPSRRENCLDIIVAQPGGTYARLECFDKKPNHFSNPSTSSSSGSSQDPSKNLFVATSQPGDQRAQSITDSPTLAENDNVKTEYISKLTPEYHQLAIAQMRNHHISTEVLGGLRNASGSEKYTSLVIATLDGTLMLVNKDKILWSLQVDHQLFALAVIEKIDRSKPTAGILPQSESSCTIVLSSASTEHESNSPDACAQLNARNCDSQSSYQYFVACAWDGKTYIVDEERNYLRFKFEEAVSAFTAGNYFFDDRDHPALIYATFNNEIILFYDVLPDSIKPRFLLNEIINNPKYQNLRDKLELLSQRLCRDDERAGASHDDSDSTKLYNLVYNILYGFDEGSLSQ